MTITSSGADLAAYLSARDRCEASPVRVTIAGRIYDGARFSQVREHPTYVHSGIRLIGDLPASYLNGNARAGYVEADGSRWYVGGWSPSRETFQSVAHVREADGSTRPQTWDDVKAYHYAGGVVPTFDLYRGTPTNRYGEPYASRPMAITIVGNVVREYAREA
jgi:hypothetical protein